MGAAEQERPFFRLGQWKKACQKPVDLNKEILSNIDWTLSRKERKAN